MRKSKRGALDARSLWDSILLRRRFAFDSPYALDECYARIEKYLTLRSVMKCRTERAGHYHVAFEVEQDRDASVAFSSHVTGTLMKVGERTRVEGYAHIRFNQMHDLGTMILLGANLLVVALIVLVIVGQAELIFLLLILLLLPLGISFDRVPLELFINRSDNMVDLLVESLGDHSDVECS